MNLADVWVNAVRQIVGESLASTPRGVTAFQATVTAVNPAAAADGRALVTVTWNGTTFPATYNRDATYAVNDRVLVQLIDADPVIVCRLGGTPPDS